jgi:hypothetical protein
MRSGFAILSDKRLKKTKKDFSTGGLPGKYSEIHNAAISNKKKNPQWRAATKRGEK